MQDFDGFSFNYGDDDVGSGVSASSLVPLRWPGLPELGEVFRETSRYTAICLCGSLRAIACRFGLVQRIASVCVTWNPLHLGCDPLFPSSLLSAL